MMRKFLGPVLVLAMGAAAWAADPAHTIAQSGRAFRPGEITINRGESLTFTNNDDFIHQIYIRQYGIGIGAGKFQAAQIRPAVE